MTQPMNPQDLNPEPAPRKWVRYDFRAQARNLGPSELSRLEKDHQRFVATVASSWSALIRGKVVAEGSSLKVSEHREFYRNLPQTAGTYLVYCKALRAHFLMAITPRVLLTLIQKLLGGTTDGDEPTADRELTRLELTLARPVLKRVLESFDETWRTNGSLELEILECEQELSRPPMRETQDPGASVVLMSSRLSVDGVSGDLIMALPRSPLLTYLSGSLRPSTPSGEPRETQAPGSAESSRGQRDPAARVLDRLEPTKLDLSVELTTRPLALRALLGMQPGDIIDTGIELTTPVALRVSGRRVARGIPGQLDGRLAVRIGIK